MARQMQAGSPLAGLEYGAVSTLVAALGALPLNRAVRVGAAVGGLLMGLDRPGRRVAMRNLEIAFPDLSPSARVAILRRTYRNWGRMIAEWAHFGELDRTSLPRLVAHDGIQHLEAALRVSKGRGTLALTAHFGNFELQTLASSFYGYPCAIVHRPLRNPFIDRAVRRARASCGNRIIERENAGREIVALLRENWLVAVALDLDVREGVFVDFFSLKAATSPAVARLAMALRTPVVPCFIVREGESTRHRVEVQPAIEIVRSANREESIRQNTQRFVRAIEAMIRRYPDHWNWIHRRWKTRPPDERRFY